MHRDRLLDQVATRIAELPARHARLASPEPSRLDRFPPPLAALLETRWAVGTLVRGVGALRGLPDAEKTRRLYHLATGADDQRCTADVSGVTDRLTLLRAPEALVQEVARWLVGWVAEGQPARGPQHERVEADYRQLAAALRTTPATPADCESLLVLIERYGGEWSGLLAQVPPAGRG